MIQELVEAAKELIWPHRRQVSIPSLDGPWAQDDRLDGLPSVASQLDDPRDVALDSDGAILLAAGKSVRRLSGTGPRHGDVLAFFESEVHGISSGKGNVIACLAGGGIRFLEGPWKGKSVDRAGRRPILCPTAALSLSPSRVAILDGSERSNGEFRRDYLESVRSGRLILADLETGRVETVLEGLDYPTSLVWDERNGRVLLTEAWGARLSAVDLNAARPDSEPILDNLPGFPWRLIPLDDGYLLSCLSLRTQLLDFVRSERRFRERMMNAVAAEYWIAPAARTTNHLYEPLQGGQILHHGVSKAWAPPRSYGLVARLDRDFRVRETWHSRHGGRRHGIVGLVKSGNACLGLSSAAGELFEVSSDA